MAIFIIPSVFSVLMIVSGILAWKWPMPWEKDNRQRYSYPHYEGKLAQKDKDTWEMSQHFFGKVQFFMGLVHIFLEIPEVMFMCTANFDDFAWKWHYNALVTPLKTVLNSSQANQSLLHFLVEMVQIH